MKKRNNMHLQDWLTGKQHKNKINEISGTTSSFWIRIFPFYKSIQWRLLLGGSMFQGIRFWDHLFHWQLLSPRPRKRTRLQCTRINCILQLIGVFIDSINVFINHLQLHYSFGFYIFQGVLFLTVKVSGLRLLQGPTVLLLLEGCKTELVEIHVVMDNVLCNETVQVFHK